MSGPTENLLGVSPASFIAGGTIAAHKLVKLDSTEGQVVVTTAITESAVGVALKSASSGDLVPVQMYGIAKCIANGSTIVVGSEVMPEASATGKVALTAGSTSISCGVALQASSTDGDVIMVLLRPSVHGATT